MIYFILLTSLALATCYLACHWRKHDGVSASQATCSLVHSLTCLLTMLLYIRVLDYQQVALSCIPLPQLPIPHDMGRTKIIIPIQGLTSTL